MLKYVKERKKLNRLFIVVCMFAALALPAGRAKAESTGYSASLATDRKSGICTYTVTGIDTTIIQEMTLKVTYSKGGSKDSSNNTDNSNITGNATSSPADGSSGNSNSPTDGSSSQIPGSDAATDSNAVTVLEKKIAIDATNCPEGVYTGSFSLEDMGKYLFKEYDVSFIIGTATAENGAVAVSAGKCDFSIHNQNCRLEVTGNKYDVNRTFDFNTNLKDDVVVPGNGNKIRLVVWKSKSSISKAVACGVERELTETPKTWETDLSTICSSYQRHKAAIVLVNKNSAESNIVLASSEFQVALVFSTVDCKKSASLEKKKSFRVFVRPLNSALGVSKVKFNIYNKKDKLVCSKAGTRNSGTAYYYADITLKSVDYNLEVYTIKVTVTDNVGNKRILSKTGKADMRLVKGSMSIQKKSNATCKFKVSGVYVPGNIKNLKFNVYSVKNGKKKFYKKYFGVNTEGNIYIADMAYTQKGNYMVYAYATTQWGKSILLNKKSFKVKKSDLGKNGWIYETYAGREYKLYYKDNKLVTDLTGILGLKKTGNNLYLEINRAACCVTAYAYDSKKKAYIIPVKSFTVSVGRDVSSTGSASALNVNTSFTPIGSYSTGTKYSLKPMYEPDGSTVYARWATHIVGNVYFHAIAVGSQSHYALSPSTYNRLGSPASAGCVRMTVADAKWIYDYASAGTKVSIVAGNSSKPGPLGKSPVITVDSTINYDPTDPEVPVSRKKADYSAGHISGYMTKSGKKVGY